MSANGRTSGPRESGGYQFPRTHSATGRRGRPIVTEGPIGPQGVVIEIVPITGLRTKRWAVDASWGQGMPGQSNGTHTVMVDSEQDARGTFRNMIEYTRAGKVWPIPEPLWTP